MKVLDADSGIVFSSSSTCMKESDNKKKRRRRRDGRTWMATYANDGHWGGDFPPTTVFFAFHGRVSVWLSWAFQKRERGEERESSACQCQLWCQHGSILLLPPVMYIYTFFFLLLLLAPLSRPRQKAALHWGRERDGQSWIDDSRGVSKICSGR